MAPFHRPTKLVVAAQLRWTRPPSGCIQQLLWMLLSMSHQHRQLHVCWCVGVGVGVVMGDGDGMGMGWGLCVWWLLFEV